MKLTKKLQAEIRRHMEGMRDCAHVLIDATNGTIYWDFDFGNMEFVAGSATNSGIIPEFTKPYDTDMDWAWNFQNFAEDACEHYEYLP